MENQINKIHIVSLKREGVTRREIDYNQHVIRDDFQDDNGHAYNDFPQFLAQIVSESPTGASCVRVLKDFISGGGFTESSANDVIVGKADEQTITGAMLNEQISNDLGYLDRFAVLVKYTFASDLMAKYSELKELTDNRFSSKSKIKALSEFTASIQNPKIKSITCMAIEWVRLGEPNESGEVNHIVYNPFFATGEELMKQQEQVYPIYNPNSVLTDYIEHYREGRPYEFGQVYFYSKTNEYNRTYSRPDFVSVKDYLISEKELALFTLRNIQNNFLIGGVINAFGNPNQPLIDNEGKEYSTAGEELERQLGTMFSGARNAGSFVVMWNRKAEEALQISPFEGNQSDKKFLEVKNQIRDSICTATGVPPILAGIQTQGKLGDANEKVGAILFMNHKTEKQRIVKDTILNALFSKLSGMVLDENGLEVPYIYEKFETKKITQYEIIPQYIFEALPEDAKIEHIKKNYDVELPEAVAEAETGATPVDSEQAKAQAQLRGSVGGVQGILNIQQGFSSGLTSRLSAITILKEIYGFSEAIAISLLGEPAEGVTTTTPNVQ